MAINEDLRDALNSEMLSAIGNDYLTIQAEATAGLWTTIGNAVTSQLWVVPAGGSTGQVLTKTSGSDYAMDWQDTSGGLNAHDELANLNWTSAAHTLGTPDSLAWIAGWNSETSPRIESFNSFRARILEGAGEFIQDSGVPSDSLGNDGNSYYDQTSGTLYAKASGTWTSTGLLQGPAGADGIDGVDGATGPQGPAGADGADGADGTQTLSGTLAPTGGLGSDGDFYIQTGVGVYWTKASGSWSITGVFGTAKNEYTNSPPSLEETGTVTWESEVAAGDSTITYDSENSRFTTDTLGSSIDIFVNLRLSNDATDEAAFQFDLQTSTDGESWTSQDSVDISARPSLYTNGVISKRITVGEGEFFRVIYTRTSGAGVVTLGNALLQASRAP